MKFYQKVFLLVLLSSSFLSAQDSFEDFKKQDMADFKKFLAEEDKAFADFLKNDWKDFQSSLGIKADPKPKPKVLPKAKEVKPVVDKTKRIEPLPPVPKTLPPPPPPPKVPVVQGKNVLKFNSFGKNLTAEIDKDVKLTIASPINNQEISKSWESLAQSNYKGTLKDFTVLKNDLHLNDWGYLILLHSAAVSAFPRSVNKQNLFIWFYLIKSGYKAKVAYAGNDILLLVPNKDMIYETRFVTVDKEKYYLISFNHSLPDINRLYTYKGSYKGRLDLINMEISSVPTITNRVLKKTIRFSYQEQPYAFEVEYSSDIVNYFKQYPQTDIRIYFNAPVSSYASYSLLAALEKHLRGKTELQAVNFLLRFVQTAFKYETDDEQFGREKYLIPEETIFYPASDCEDRSILFSYLVRNLLHLDVVALDYPGHLATAVRFNGNIEGDVVNYAGKKYVICDPTYINADAGMCMPQFKNVNPKVIKI